MSVQTKRSSDKLVLAHIAFPLLFGFVGLLLSAICFAQENRVYFTAGLHQVVLNGRTLDNHLIDDTLVTLPYISD